MIRFYEGSHFSCFENRVADFREKTVSRCSFLRHNGNSDGEKLKNERSRTIFLSGEVDILKHPDYFNRPSDEIVSPGWLHGQEEGC